MAGGGKGSRKKRDTLTPHYCEIPFCGYSRVFQRHRIVPGREGGRYKLGNVIALCPNHHAEADRGWIPREELLIIVRIRVKRDADQDINYEAVQELQEEQTGEGVPFIGGREDPAMGLQRLSEYEESGILPRQDS